MQVSYPPPLRQPSGIKRFVPLAIAVLFGGLVFWGIQWLISGTERSTSQPADSTYDRVIRKGKIRVGYVNYPPSCIKDTSTGKVRGAFVDVLEKIGNNLGLEVEYAEEVGWGTLIQGLENDRYDIVGSATWANPVRGKLCTLSDPVYFTGIGVWVRQDDMRLTTANYLTAINDSAIRIAAMDGSTPLAIAKAQFPAATLKTYPDLTGEAQLFLDLTTGKADVFFAEPAVAADFVRNNPNKIKNLAVEHPIRTFANVFLMKKNEFQMKEMIDNAVRDLQASGFVDEALRRYEPFPNAFYRVAVPYRVK